METAPHSESPVDSEHIAPMTSTAAPAIGKIPSSSGYPSADETISAPLFVAPALESPVDPGHVLSDSLGTTSIPAPASAITESAVDPSAPITSSEGNVVTMETTLPPAEREDAQLSTTSTAPVNPGSPLGTPEAEVEPAADAQETAIVSIPLIERANEVSLNHQLILLDDSFLTCFG